jgi:hypothetical protein
MLNAINNGPVLRLWDVAANHVLDWWAMCVIARCPRSIHAHTPLV